MGKANIPGLEAKLIARREVYKDAGQPLVDANWTHLTFFGHEASLDKPEVVDASRHFWERMCSVMEIKSEGIPQAGLIGMPFIHLGMEVEEMDLLDAIAYETAAERGLPLDPAPSTRQDVWHTLGDTVKPIIVPRNWTSCFVPVVQMEQRFEGSIREHRPEIGLTAQYIGNGTLIQRDRLSQVSPLVSHRNVYNILSRIIDSTRPLRRGKPLDPQFTTETSK